MTCKPARQIVAIDLLRFICAALVMTFHYLTVFPLAPTATIRAFDRTLALAGDDARWTWFGWVGVQIFFVVSGYVIARSGEGMTARGFLRRRILRLAPAAWICASLSAACLFGFSLLAGPMVALRWVEAIFFLPTPTPIDSAYWTLTVELCFYLLVATRLRGDAGDSARIERIGVVLGSASIAYWLIVALIGASPDLAMENLIWRMTSLPYGVFFALGIMLWAIRDRGATPARIACATILFAGSCGQIAANASSMADLRGLFAFPIAPIIVFAAAVTLIIGAARVQEPLVRVIGTTRLVTLGLMTYPLYLLHQSIGAVLIVHAVRAGMAQSVAIILACALAILLAWGVTRWLERPLRHWLAARLPEPRLRRALPPDIPPSASLPAG
ncbi:acyltransferase [Sphingomonas sp. So64.6b]|uniref:acyltransferase family protein n=1 Tax=Sphingomonas sp. So64.6b TaxID=2997354 RepID=UPI001FCE7B04|nr:acyltransferase [Sphingomonas sp. So64.6b]